MSVAFVAVPYMPRVSLLLIPLLASAVGRGISQPALMSMASSYSTPETRGSVMGTFQSAASLGRVLGPLAAGLLYDQLQAGPFLLAAGLMVVALAIGTTLPARVGGQADAERGLQASR